MSRPKLNINLSEASFLHHYWLKSELAQFCRKLGLPVSGSKELLTDRIANHLAGRPQNLSPKKPKNTDPLPESLTLSTVIGNGWRCSRKLREFMVSHCGPGFHFNDAMRRFLKESAGKTLKEAIEVYRESLSVENREIPPQFEYNRHMREFKLNHPGCSHAQAVEAWWKKRQR